MPIWDRPLPFVILLFLLFALLILAGCNKYSRYRVFRILFDGVPHPDEVLKKEEPSPSGTVSEEQSEINELPASPARYTHPLVGDEGECTPCHGSPKSLIVPPKDICLKCHMYVIEKRPFIHGPAALECLVCHDHHESQVKTLLRITGNDLCFECHYNRDKESAQKVEAHKELNESEFVCIKCHEPHGGEDRFFLRKNIIIQKEDTQEDSSHDEIIQEEDIQEDSSHDEIIQEEDIKEDSSHDEIIQEETSREVTYRRDAK